MLQIDYRKLNKNDLTVVRKIVGRRWLAILKRFGITFLLPIICGVGVSLFLNIIYLRARIPDRWSPGVIIDLIYPKSLEDIETFGFFLFPAFFIISIANIWMFIITIPPIYIDLLKRRKKVIYFKPEQYMIAESSKYYIKTNVAEFPFFEVDFNTYCDVENTDSLILEMLPVTKVLLAIKTKDETSITPI
jgi:hypothetical protein